MDDREQKAGEARVQALLIDHLDRCGFGRPGAMALAQFEAMRRELCQRLAYMTAPGLSALAEVMEQRGGGAARDRFPVLPTVMAEAAKIEQPPEDASPFIRRVFAHDAGRVALAEGWAPELLRHVRENRGLWPGPMVLAQLRDNARNAMGRMQAIERRLASGATLSPDDADWRRRRLAATDRARRARDLGLADANVAAPAGAAE